MTLSKYLVAAPAVALVAGAGVYALLAGFTATPTDVTSRPVAAKIEESTPAGLVQTTTARDWQEVAGSRPRG